VEVRRLDLADLSSVREFAAGWSGDLDLLINNAGVMYTDKAKTKDGFELQFGTNHLGHFALTGLLLDALLPVPGSRIVTVSSVGHRIRAAIHFDDLQWERSYSRVGAYGQSKLANLMFTYELQRRLMGSSRSLVAGEIPGAGDLLPAAAVGEHSRCRPAFKARGQTVPLPALRRERTARWGDVPGTGREYQIH
jgi:NAD(P)-dependent dehydrogenase (short-subunit alcohol dehydrogenase family)